MRLFVNRKKRAARIVRLCMLAAALLLALPELIEKRLERSGRLLFFFGSFVVTRRVCDWLMLAALFLFSAAMIWFLFSLRALRRRKAIPVVLTVVLSLVCLFALAAECASLGFTATENEIYPLTSPDGGHRILVVNDTTVMGTDECLVVELEREHVVRRLRTMINCSVPEEIHRVEWYEDGFEFGRNDQFGGFNGNPPVYITYDGSPHS